MPGPTLTKSLRNALLLGLLATVAATSQAAPPPPDEELLFGGRAGKQAGGSALDTVPVMLRAAAPDESVVPGSSTSVEVYFDVEEHSYVNHEMTRVTLLGEAGLEIGEPVFPEPQVKEVASLGKVAKIHKGSFVVRVPIDVQATAAPGLRSLALTVRYQACNEQVCFIPKTEKTAVLLRVAEGAAVASAAVPAEPGTAAPMPAAFVVPPASQGAATLPLPAEAPAAPKSEFDRQLEKGLLFAFLFAFFGGVLASLTPCVYPMIPITVAVIGARGAQSRRASFLLSLVFVLGIAVVYSVLGVTAAATGSVFGSILQNRLVVLLVSAIFAGLALGMMGFYDMNVPPSIANRLNRMGGKGYGGALIVGMVTGVVASPCVGPVLVGMLGWVATAASNPAYAQMALPLGFSLMFTFALGLGMLFLLIGTFTGVLVSLPRSGTWMVKIKHLLGILLFGVAWYFALPVLPVWLPGLLLVPGLAGLALTELESPRGRKLASAWMGAAATYVALLGASALWPGTVQTGWTSLAQVRGAGHGESVAWLQSEPDALRKAASDGKPVMIDFYAEWCIACKELDLYTYADPAVAKALESFVSVKIDGTDDTRPEIRELYRKYGVLGLPTVVFLTPDGRVLPRLTLTGFEKPDAFLKRLASVVPPPRSR